MRKIKLSISNPFETNPEIKSLEISLAHDLLLNTLVVLIFCAEHGNNIAVLFAKISKRFGLWNIYNSWTIFEENWVHDGFWLKILYCNRFSIMRVCTYNPTRYIIQLNHFVANRRRERKTYRPRCLLLWYLIYDYIAIKIRLTRWRRVTHICVGNLNTIGSDNGLSPGRRGAIIWTNVGMFLIRLLVKFYLKFIHFHSREYIRNCRPRYYGHFVSASMC